MQPNLIQRHSNLQDKIPVPGNQKIIYVIFQGHLQHEIITILFKSLNFAISHILWTLNRRVFQISR